MKKLIFIVVFLLSLTSYAEKDVDLCHTFCNKIPMGLLNAGEKALAKENYAEAIKNFKALDAVYPFGPYAKQAALDIIYAYYKNCDTAFAIAAAKRYIHLYPRDSHVDYAYYMRGIIAFDLKLSWLQELADISPAARDVSTLQRSFIAFSTLVQVFPHSLYTPDALARMRYIRNLIAQREITIAEFYMKRHAYMAAANRASYVVQHFQGSPQVIKGLIIMILAYRALDLPKMADSIYYLLQTNYSNTPELKHLKT
ncbi:outer membrane protein assembly factor BamD [Coxiella endosymbiont of Amblyomma nuttalli]|uniref:outer membrane protein assembly factor BamD n=1 Tax=Coxiella endosymbiont of Amblyomma nuttalli TaxID=2749996 RepID=UPI001BAC866F|nr:outer membrane protein assembly factor BamD [Coxiella endosymbiont of Amblyomma nuttalli]QTS84120.1 Outer membrane protein assembly factor BamD precursor [Coxiella endosymbiont of Amblyomma nuttalli]